MELMDRRLNLLAASVIVAGISTLAAPRPAHATYVNPIRTWGVTYCCTTGSNTCCGNYGCMTKEGACLIIMK
jgi:hypothetical protein